MSWLHPKRLSQARHGRPVTACYCLLRWMALCRVLEGYLFDLLSLSSVYNMHTTQQQALPYDSDR